MCLFCWLLCSEIVWTGRPIGNMQAETNDSLLTFYKFYWICHFYVIWIYDLLLYEINCKVFHGLHSWEDPVAKCINDIVLTPNLLLVCSRVPISVMTWRRTLNRRARKKWKVNLRFRENTYMSHWQIESCLDRILKVSVNFVHVALVLCSFL